MRCCWCLRSRADWSRCFGGGFEVYGVRGVAALCSLCFFLRLVFFFLFIFFFGTTLTF